MPEQLTLAFAESVDLAKIPSPLQPLVGACATCRHAQTQRGSETIPYIGHGYGVCGRDIFYGTFLPRLAPRMDLPVNQCWEGTNALHHPSGCSGAEPR